MVLTRGRHCYGIGRRNGGWGIAMTFEQWMRAGALLQTFLSALAWPLALVAIAVIFRRPLGVLLANVKRAELPWGAGTLEFREEAERLSVEANQPDPDRASDEAAPAPEHFEDYNGIQLKRGLRPTPSGLKLDYFRSLVARDPNLALAALRMEVEALICNLADGNGLEPREADGPLRNLKRIHRHGAITDKQFATARKIIDLCNRALHGQPVDTLTAFAVIDAAEPLVRDYKSWLFWNFGTDGDGAPSGTGTAVNIDNADA